MNRSSSLTAGVLTVLAALALYLYLQNVTTIMYTSLSRFGETCIIVAGDQQNPTCLPENLYQLGFYASGFIAVIGLIFIAKAIFQNN
jgi:hypothetical protein